ncbi:MAG: aminopeptidase P family protein [Candidatus Helarchaeota archaeon]|nr:aminopeptidase P family protein [Candidatus Helarchaeota archaeon]
MVLFRRDSERPKPIGYDQDKAANLMKQYKLDVLIVSSPENVFYASGLPVRHHAMNPILYALRNQYPSIGLIYSDGEESLIVWDIYDRQLTWIRDTKGCLTPKSALRSIKKFVKKRKITEGNIGVESSLPFYITSFLKETFPQATLVPADNLLLDMQLTKSEEEIRRITESTRIAEQAILKMIEATNPGISDIELIQLAKKTIIDEGAEGWDHFTMSIGESDPEAPGTGIKVQSNDLVRYDIGAFYKGYVSDVNRYCYLGEPPPEVKEPIEAIIQVQNACQKAIKPSADPKEIMALAEKTWRETGRQDVFIIIAHSLGLRTEEFHFFDPMHGSLERKFQKGNVLDLEAWTLIKNYGTVGNEDTYVVTETGCKRISTLDMKLFQK